MIHRIDLANEAKDAGARTFAGTQLIWMTIGVALFVAVIIGLRDHRRLQAFTYTAGLAAIVLLLLPLIPGLGTQHQRRPHLDPPRADELPARRDSPSCCWWSRSPATSCCTATPSRWPGAGSCSSTCPAAATSARSSRMWLVSLGILVFQNDLGSSLLFFGLFLVMLYVATERPGWLVVGGALFAVGAYFGYLALSHVQLRVQAWLDPFDPDARAFQIVQGLYGMAWGGMVGRGLGQGNPEITPYSYSDFILPSIGEELGLTGVMAVILLYGILVERGLRTALICRDNFGKLMASGLAIVVRAAGLRGPRRRHQADPADRSDHAVPVVRRVQSRRQLGDHRAAAAHLRPGPPPTAGADRARRGLRRRCHPGGEDPQMNKPIRNLAVGCMLLFMALLLNATYVQYWQADDLTSLSKHPDNKRVRDAEFSRERGAILVRGKAVAESNKSDDEYKFQRAYPQARAVRPPDRLLLPRLRARRRRGDPELRSCPAATRGCS